MGNKRPPQCSNSTAFMAPSSAGRLCPLPGLGEPWAQLQMARVGVGSPATMQSAWKGLGTTTATPQRRLIKKALKPWLSASRTRTQTLRRAKRSPRRSLGSLWTQALPEAGFEPCALQWFLTINASFLIATVSGHQSQKTHTQDLLWLRTVIRERFLRALKK